MTDPVLLFFLPGRENHKGALLSLDFEATFRGFWFPNGRTPEYSSSCSLLRYLTFVKLVLFTHASSDVFTTFLKEEVILNKSFSLVSVITYIHKL